MAPPSGDDDRILTYGDSTLVRSDLSILCGPQYLNDRLIHFFFSHLAVSRSYPDDILLVPPSIAYLIANYPDPTSLTDVVAPLKLRDKALVLFPVNDNPDVNLAEGGSHWSLLICHVPSREFVHHDSTGCLNSVHAYKLYQLVQHFLGDVQFGYHEGPTPRQTNGYDCGLYVMAIARCVCEWYCKVKNNGSADGKEKWFDVLREQLNGDKVHELRGELLSLVLKLTQQNDSKKMPGSQNGRSFSSNEMRPIKTETIHSYARNGYLHGLQRMLQENPSLLNARDSMMRETPLHVASAKNDVDVLKYLLDWTGPETAELEVRNTYGETPLHVAIKNSSCESAKLLLQHGAALEAKADNGMTPLHLAVWHAIPSGDCTTVSMLLSHNAECSIKDNEGKTPIDHLLAGPTYERLRNLLNQHQLMQRKRKALESCQEAEAMAEFDKSISHVIGLKKMKLQMRKWARGMLLDEKRRAMGLDIEERKVPHMAFLGNPGTGKTMVAHILGKLLHHVGILPTDRVTVVQRTDLVGEFVGHTGPKTRRKIKEAEGGILFVDEAYRLIPMQKTDDKDYGIEALEEIMSVMDEGKVVVIFAGYREPMKRVIDANEGFRRRVEKFFYFDDFTPLELAEILHLKIHCLKGYKLHQRCTIHALARLIEKETTDKLRKEWNGGLIIPWLKNARDNLDERLDFDVEDTEVMVTITLGDLEKGLHQISEESPDEVWRV